MRKIVSLILALMLIGALAYAQGPQQGKGQRMQRGGGPGMNRLIFGITQKDFQALGLTQEQQTKLTELQKAYNEKFMKMMPQDNQNSPQKIDQKEMEKMRAEQQKANEQLLKDFKSILTEDQLKAYDTAYKAQIEKTKTQLTKQYATIGEKISLKDEQKTKLAELIKNYDGNEMTFNENFMKLLTDEQKTALQTYQKEQMEQMMKNRGGRQGGQRGGKGQMPPQGPMGEMPPDNFQENN